MDFKKNLFWAIPFIVVGIVLILNNTGLIHPMAYEIILSWQMLIWYLGVNWIFRKHYKIGVIAFLLGALFLVPKLGWMNAYLDKDMWEICWPIIFVFIGLFILFRPCKKKSFHWNNHGRDSSGNVKEGTKCNFINTDGYVESDNTFGYVEQIVLDPYFKGARIKTLFGGTALDLRRTKLENPQTYIDIDCTFAGVEIYIPNDWQIEFIARPFMGGCEDKRFNVSVEMDREHVLVIRGNVTFGGIEIKS